MTAAAAFAGIVVFHSALAAWSCLDLGNIALLEGRRPDALRWFDRGLRSEPGWNSLHEDRGRALLHSDPQLALAEFKIANCGAPCIAQEGDALVRLGKFDAALDRYMQVKAVARIGLQAQRIAAEGRYEEAGAIERALIARLSDPFYERADLARAYEMLGQLEGAAAATHPTEARRHGEASARAFATASTLAPFNEGYQLSYGFAELKYGSRSAAVKAFRRVLELHPHQADAESALKSIAASP
ncbi:MAG: hypothetical protein DLM53_01865 [Candidatus Eremiobacter antarcticus]|nr:hypothetical protein [Candidatus Eremiobacteraeota bacterium]MBC5808152.1 hypothetical protein [Candidatus Eremiobacteraeota bacterium]PZR63547.1 MAG: hypothetical protein DLM53_01865 [Candidatus Eremiobacter sp. RRmetagenome_bin22]